MMDETLVVEVPGYEEFPGIMGGSPAEDAPAPSTAAGPAAVDDSFRAVALAFLRVLVTPRKVFRSVDASAWLTALLVVGAGALARAIVYAGADYWWGSDVPHVAAGATVNFVAPLLLVGIAASAILGVWKVADKPRPGLTAVAIASIAAAPLVLQMALQIVMMVAMQAPLVPVGLFGLVVPDAPWVARFLLAQFDVFGLWTFALVIVAAVVTTRVPKPKTRPTPPAGGRAVPVPLEHPAYPASLAVPDPLAPGDAVPLTDTFTVPAPVVTPTPVPGADQAVTAQMPYVQQQAAAGVQAPAAIAAGGVAVAAGAALGSAAAPRAAAAPATPDTATFGRRRGSAVGRIMERVVPVVAWTAVLALVAVCFSVIAYLFVEGIAAISWSFISSDPQPALTENLTGGIRTPIAGTFILLIMGTLFVVPPALATAIYLSEYMREDSWLTRTVRMGLEALAGVPSVVFGMFGIAFFALPAFTILSGHAADANRAFGRSFLVGCVVMACHILPFVIKVMEEAIRGVPKAYRQAAAALGMPKWAATWKIVLPSAAPGLMTAVILGMGLIAGDTAIIKLCVGDSMVMTGSPQWWMPWNWAATLRGMGSTLTTYTYYSSAAGEGNSPTKAFGAAFLLIVIVLALNLAIEFIMRLRSARSK